MIFVDSSVWIDWFRGSLAPQAKHLDNLITSERVLVGDLVIAETVQGATSAAAFQQMRSVMLSLTIVNVVSVYTAFAAAANCRRLRELGITPRGTIDTLIATRCILESWPLLSSDRDFRPFAEHLGLHLVAP